MINIPLISIITPTHNRDLCLRTLYVLITRQSWANIEWLIYDDSVEPSWFMGAIRDTRVRYWHDTTRRSIGEKRNILVSRAKGEYIVHCDDDDYYSPHYVSVMHTALTTKGADICKLSGFFLFYRNARTLAYWDLLIKTGYHFEWNGKAFRCILLTDSNNGRLAKAHMGFGFSYVYRRAVWESTPFPHLDRNEDGEFLTAAAKHSPTLLMPDTTGICLHVIHRNNSSRCFPQVVLPSFMSKLLFSWAPVHPDAPRGITYISSSVNGGAT
jgi:glycosyltransferase involved in cell wall biosynthesis